MTIEKYAAENANGELIGSLEDDIDDARRTAREHGAMLVAYTFEFTDSELVEDYSRAKA